ncbi:hypothetical protein GCM10027511_29520 [Hymenobacter humi]
MLGLQAPEDLVGRPIRDLAHPAHPAHRDDWAALHEALWYRSLTSFALETRLQRRNGSGRPMVIGSLRDISAAKRHQHAADAFNARKNAVLEILSYYLSGSFAIVQQIAQFLAEEVAVPAGSQPARMCRC